MVYEPDQEFAKKKYVETLRFVSIAGSFCAIALLLRGIAVQPGEVIPFWPPAGIALAAILNFGYTLWPAILIGDFAKNLWLYLDGGSIGTLIQQSILLLIISIGATLQAVMGSILLKGYTRSSQLFSNPKYTIRFLLMTLVFCTINATVATVCLFNAGKIGVDEVFRTWCIWWLGDSIGIVLLVPLLSMKREEFYQLFTNRRWIETVLSHAIIIFAALSISDDRVENSIGGMIKPFHLLPLLVWIAYRQSMTGACIACISILWIVFYFTNDPQNVTRWIDGIPSVIYRQSLAYSIIAMVLLIVSTLEANRLGRLDLENQSRDLREKSAELKAVIAAQPDTYLWLDDEGEIVRYHANDDTHLFSRLHSGLRLPDIIPPSLKPKFDTMIDQVRELRSPAFFEYSVTSRSKTKYNEARFLPLMEKNVLVVIRDITDLKNSELNLQASVKKARFAAEIGAVMTAGTQLDETLGDCARLIAQHMEVAIARIWVLRDESDILELTASAGANTALDGEFSKIPLGIHYPGKVALTGKPMFTNRISWTERLNPEELDASKGLKAFAGYPLQLDGRRIGVIGLFSDRDIQPNVIESLASVSNTISIGIEQHWSKLELLRARASSEAASRLKSELLADFGHEISTPIIGILSKTEKLLDTDLNNEQRTCLDAIRSSGEILRKIADDIADASMIESGRLRLDDSDFRLRGNLSEMIRPLDSKAQRTGLKLEYEVHADVPDTMQGDWKRLRLILVAVIGNAMKFTTRAEIVLSVTALGRNEDDVTLQFLVRNRGYGIVGQSPSHHFDPIANSYGSMADFYDEEKMGLGISSMLVSKMGGEIRFENSDDKAGDCSFTVRMRVAEKPVRSAEHPSSEALKGFV